jgi:hypothetical protein
MNGGIWWNSRTVAPLHSQTRSSSTPATGREIPKGPDMTTPEARKAAPTLDLSATKAAVWLSATAFLALIVLYFVGMDQGATSIFGSDTHVHEFIHDARHLLGFPCH